MGISDANSAAPTAKKKRGRKSSYSPKYDELAHNFCLLGATDEQLAENFGVTRKTLQSWKRKHPKFLSAIKSGKNLADAEIARSLFDRAKGATWKEQQAFKCKDVTWEGNHRVESEHIEVVWVERAAPPDTEACKVWLMNRAKEYWRQKQDGIADADLAAVAQAMRDQYNMLMGQYGGGAK
jgi:hypothetical protein